MALKVENKKWSSDAVSIDDIPEDTDWVSVFFKKSFIF